MSLYQQWLTAGYMLLTGWLLALMFDVCKALYQRWAVNLWFVWIGDCLYWLCAGWLMFAFLLAGSEGRLRIYVPIFLLLGGLLYFQMRKYILELILRRSGQRGRRKRSGQTQKY